MSKWLIIEISWENHIYQTYYWKKNLLIHRDFVVHSSLSIHSRTHSVSTNIEEICCYVPGGGGCVSNLADCLIWEVPTGVWKEPTKDGLPGRAAMKVHVFIIRFHYSMKHKCYYQMYKYLHASVSVALDWVLFWAGVPIFDRTAPEGFCDWELTIIAVNDKIYFIH
jgi:hypothetical protein